MQVWSVSYLKTFIKSAASVAGAAGTKIILGVGGSDLLWSCKTVMLHGFYCNLSGQIRGRLGALGVGSVLVRLVAFPLARLAAAAAATAVASA
jgi:hypothetical protein